MLLIHTLGNKAETISTTLHIVSSAFTVTIEKVPVIGEDDNYESTIKRRTNDGWSEHSPPSTRSSTRSNPMTIQCDRINRPIGFDTKEGYAVSGLCKLNCVKLYS